MGAMSCQRERGTEGGVIDETLTSRIIDSILGKQRTCERSSSYTSSGPVGEEPTKKVTEDVGKEPTNKVTEDIGEEPTNKVIANVSLRKLKQDYSRAVKRKVSSQQYVDIRGSDSESESDDNDDDESGPETSPEFLYSDVGDRSVVASGNEKAKHRKEHVCEECGISVKKPALLIQHMRTHSSQKPFVCPHDGCGCAYKRQDHLNRHLKKHQGVDFVCPKRGCDTKFTIYANLQRHLKLHAEKETRPNSGEEPSRRSSGEKGYLCSWPDCGKSFRYPSFLQTHESCHEKLEFVEMFCMYPGCGDKFSSEEALVTHAETSHPYLLCEVCGETIDRKSFMRHARTHATKTPLEVVCPYDGCGNTYTRESNLQQHVRSVHLELKPFTCSHAGCGKRYAHKAARDRHESAAHAQPSIDFHAQDERLLSRPRGGRKPIAFDKVETYLRKRRADDLSR